MKHCLFFILYTALCLNTPLNAGLAQGTLITTPAGNVRIETLSQDDVVVGYCSEFGTYPDVKLEALSCHPLDEIVVIKTDCITIYASPDQLFYEVRKDDFVAAQDLLVNDVLMTKDIEPCTVQSIDIRKLEQPTSYCDITLEEPHLFFCSDAELLAHNAAAIGYALSGSGAAEWFMGAVVALVALHRSPEIFPTTKAANDKVLKVQKTFMNGRDQWPSAKKNMSYPCPSQPPAIAGIMPDPTVYCDMMRSPLLHGPMCITAALRDDGRVDVFLYVLRFETRKLTTNIFCWKQFGRHIVDRDQDLVKAFVAQEDKKQLDELKAALKKWPPKLTSIISSAKCTLGDDEIAVPSGCTPFEKKLHGLQCGTQALYNMANKKISPHLVACTIFGGEPFPARHPDRMIYCKVKNDVAVVIDKKTNKILNVGHHSCDMESLDTPHAETERKIRELLKRTRFLEEKRFAKIYEKDGDFNDAIRDFESLGLAEVRDDLRDIKKDKIVRIGTLPDGRKVIVRNDSKDLRPTLEIQPLPGSKDKSIKIRYGKKPGEPSA